MFVLYNIGFLQFVRFSENISILLRNGWHFGGFSFSRHSFDSMGSNSFFFPLFFFLSSTSVKPGPGFRHHFFSPYLIFLPYLSPFSTFCLLFSSQPLSSFHPPLLLFIFPHCPIFLFFFPHFILSLLLFFPLLLPLSFLPPFPSSFLILVFSFLIFSPPFNHFPCSNTLSLSSFVFHLFAEG